MGTASVEAVKAPPVPSMQKPPCRVGKWFRDHHVAAPMREKVKKPVGLKTRPAWLRQDRLGSDRLQGRRQLFTKLLFPGWVAHGDVPAP
jgi:hypothetical protein